MTKSRLPLRVWLVLFASLGATGNASLAQSAGGDGSETNNHGLLAAPLCLLDCAYYREPEAQNHDYAQPNDPPAPYYETDWSLGLRGSYRFGSEPTVYGLRVDPAFSLDHTHLRGQLSVDFSGVVRINEAGITQIENLNISVSNGVNLDPLTGLELAASVDVSQEMPGAPGVSDVLEIAPIIGVGRANIGINRQFGAVGLSLSADVARTLMSSSYLTGALERDNADLNALLWGGALRASFELTPVLSPFVEASAHRTQFDAAPVSTGIKRDGWEYDLTAGVTSSWQDILELEASVGYGVRQFDNRDVGAGLADLETIIYGLGLAYAPGADVAVNIDLGTSLNTGDPDAGTPANVDYQASATIAYLVNDWLNTRGSLSGTYRPDVLGLPARSNYQAGIGLDYLFSQHTGLTLDYTYSLATESPAADEFSHEIAIGFRFSK